jgi:cell division protein FtsA
LSEKGVVVLDIGTTKVVALYAALGEDSSLVIRGLVTVDGRGMKKGLVADLDDVARIADQALRHLGQEIAGINLSAVVLTISGTHLEGSIVQGFKPIIPKNRIVTHQDVMEVVKISRSGMFPTNRVQIQALPREFRVDEKRGLSQPVGLTASKLEVVTYVVSGGEAQVSNMERAITLHGKSVAQFIYAPMASGIGVLNADELEQGAMVIDIGGSKTDLGIFTNGAMAYGTCIPAGGNNVTSDISQLINTAPDEAEKLKIEYGSAISGKLSGRDAIDVRQLGQPIPRPMQKKVLCEIIESRMVEIAKLTQVHLEKSGYEAQVRSIVLTGGGSQLSDLNELFMEAFPGLKVRVAEPKIKEAKGQVGLAAAIGAAYFVLQSQNDLTPIRHETGWQDLAKGLWSQVTGR